MDLRLARTANIPASVHTDLKKCFNKMKITKMYETYRNIQQKLMFLTKILCFTFFNFVTSCFL